MTITERAQARQRSNTYKVGWWFLVAAGVVSLLGHTAGALGFFGGPDEGLLFIGFAALNAYALAVLVFAYRRNERWAWWITWTMVAAYALAIFYAPMVGRDYLILAVLMGIAQLTTWPSFRQGQDERSHA